MKLFRFSYLFFIFFVLAVLINPGSFVSAHSTLVDTYPEGGEELSESPKTVGVWFQDPVTVHSKSIQILNSKGETFYNKKPKIDTNNKNHIIAHLDENLPDGDYNVKINVIAPDGDILNEKFSFKVSKEEKDKIAYENFKLVKSFPKDGEITEGPIDQLDLWFNQPINVTMIGLFNDEKTQIAMDLPKVDPNDPTHVIIETYEPLSPGTYQISWFGKPIENPKQVADSMGVYYFAVETFTPMDPPGNETLIRWFDYIGLKQFSYWMSFIGLGLLFGFFVFNKMIIPIKSQSRFKYMHYCLVFMSIMGIFLFLMELRKELGDLPLSEFFQLKFALVPIIQIALISLSLLSRKLGIYLIGISLFIWPFVAGHSSYPRYGGWMTLAVSELHLFAVSIWLGGLFTLIVFAPKNTEVDWLKSSAYKFSKWALACVIIIATTGVWMSVQYLPSYSMESLVKSAFGRALIIKIVLFLFMLMIAFFQRQAIKNLTSKFVKGFVFKLRIELLYGIIILFFAALLVVSTPSAAEQGIYPKKISVKDIVLSVDIEPFFTGFSTMTLDFNNNPEIESVKVTLQMPPDWKKTNEAFKVEQGLFKLTGMMLHAAGTVNMEVEAKKENGEIIKLPFKIVVPGEIRFNE